jgi:hypothetical protein
MSASSQIAVLLENEVLVASPESDAIQVEGSEFCIASPRVSIYSSGENPDIIALG